MVLSIGPLACDHDAPIGPGTQSPLVPGPTAQELHVPRISPTDTPQPGTPSPWAPLRRLLWLCLGLTVLATGAALAWLRATGAPMRWELLLAVSIAVAGTLLLTGALMGLVFVSNQSGHDASVGRGDRAGDD
jgi:hypothetical protein